MGLQLPLEYPNPTCIKHDSEEVITAEKLKAELRRGLCVKAKENNLAWYVRNSNERLLVGVRKIKILDTEGAKEKNEFKRARLNQVK